MGAARILFWGYKFYSSRSRDLTGKASKAKIFSALEYPKSGICGPFWKFWKLKKITVTGVTTLGLNRRFSVTAKPKLALYGGGGSQTPVLWAPSNISGGASAPISSLVYFLTIDI